MQMLTSLTHFLPMTVIRRARLLPVPGKMVVRKGQRVNAIDVVAEANLAPEHLLLDIARGLGLPAEKADKYIQRQPGEEVAEGDLIAGPVGFPKRVVRAPRDGKVVITGSGQVLIELERRPFEMRAGLTGVVTELMEDQGIQIENTGALVQGVWGNERIDSGLLAILLKTPDETLTPERLSVEQRGLIVVGGYCSDPAVFTTAAQLPIRGLILASMESDLIPTAEKMPYPVMLLEGFGKIPMNAAAFRLLSTSDRREGALNTERWNRHVDTRPELVIALPAPGNISLPNEVGNVVQGKQARLVAAPHQGVIGIVMGVRPGLATLASGVRAQVVDLRLENGESIFAPLANLEIID